MKETAMTPSVPTSAHKLRWGQLRSKNLRLRGMAAAAALAVVAVGGVAAVPAAASTYAPPAASPGQDELRDEVARTLREAGYVGMSVEVHDGRRRILARAGEAELHT
ncbi:hypothetical protein AB4Z54_62390, partial [Streptomyces sp. MCAF7]